MVEQDAIHSDNENFQTRVWVFFCVVVVIIKERERERTSGQRRENV